MAQYRKRFPTQVICEKIKDTESIDDLSELIRNIHPRIAGFEIDADEFDRVQEEDTVVLEALVVHLRKIIEADEDLRRQRRLQQEEDEEEEIDYDN
jgi:hypothetical protein